MTFKIDTDAPIVRKDNSNGKYGVPMRKLTKIGYSFFIPNIKITKLTNALFRWKMKLGIDITMRTEGNGVRVWRIK